MTNQQEHTTYLFNKWMNGEASSGQEQELLHLLAMLESNDQLHTIMNKGWQGLNNIVELTDEQKASIAKIATGKSTDQHNKYSASVRFIHKWRWVAAAILILLLGSGIYYFNIQSLKLPVINRGTGETRGTMGDIAPGTNRAILRINNNRNIDLATNKTGININNSITYNDGEKIADAGQMLQLTTPRGGQYQAVLPDGSRVWLNAASSIKFPSKFTDKERRIEVTGEVYFEVAKVVGKPFRVYSGEQQIEVLGTSFNINIYNDEPIKKTTLITGSIKITNNNQTAILKPGQQAIIVNHINLVNLGSIQVQTNGVLAWKNGLFNFENKSLEEVMRQLSRWYDVEVKYVGDPPKEIFKGEIPRTLLLSEAMEILTALKIKFKVEERTITIIGKTT